MLAKGIIFDLFHTLTGRESEWSNLPWTSDVLGIDRGLWDNLLTSHSDKRLTGKVRDPFKIILELAHSADPAIPQSLVREAVRIRTQRFRDCLMRIPQENIEALKRMRVAGLRLGLISNCDALEVGAWPGSPLDGCFDAAIFSCEAGCAKPEPAIYAKCLDTLGLPAEECLYVGDGGSDELIGAKNAGLSTVFISGVIAELWPQRVAGRIASADYHIRNVPEILPLIGVDCPGL
jgi:putative hydrolase of the HAD superfamily